VLGNQHEIVYGLDLRPERPSAEAEAPRRALVVVDPTGDLPGARAEGLRASRILTERGAQVTRLVGRECAPDRITDLLARVDLLHYAGHARGSRERGWQSALLLANGAMMSPGTLLSLPSVPRRVFLSGCDTAVSPQRPVLDLGVAQAFLLAGAEEVIASTRPVEDALATRIATAVLTSTASRWSAALHDAQRAVRARQPSADWAAFRVFGE
jgi:CHAT domain-containing protein